MAPPPASLHEEPEAPERLDSPAKSFAKVTLELPSESNGLPNNHPETQNDSRNYKAVQSPGEYEGAGILDAPPSPTRGHKRLSSRSSRSSLRGAKTLKKNGSSDEKAEAVVYEKHEDGNGGQLTSVKPTEDYEKNLKTDEKEYKPITNGNKEEKSSKGEQELELTSGRVASAGWEKSGIRFAPLNVPFKRRLQTCAVLFHTLSVAVTLGWFFFLCAIPFLWPLLIPYLIYVLLSKAGTSGELSQRSDWLRRQKIWSLFASYFPARLHRTTELVPTRKYLFGYHPHGIISHGAFAAFGTEALGFSQLFPGIKNTLLTLESNFRVPLYRDYILRMGLASVSRESCENILSKGGADGEGMGRAITIVVGGARESLETQPGTLRLILNTRKGFVKLAIRTGADLVPVLGFGENDIYEQISPAEHPWVHHGQLFFKKVMGFTVPLFHARGIFNYDVGIMPYRRPMNIVVGRPIEVVKMTKPTQEYIDELHGKYCAELRLLWESWKDTFAKERIKELEIIE
ncbi:hypothetical protein BLS_010103 [Venturia inaequalis]|uniref:diacylglycerol O-acyltransferase n=1 Tax=Venturia inaequalis TaxID=5025 RepID=A0A8H3U448_VENIN|nr:hypothetical protein BLS_010103 [Venturia inaequalis]KAE9980935.1 hypothetical protein EG328_011953 [Venturia inaequalis]KAE9992068.1 hypothetical protein EG327_010169 [Venturia inaequalis]RDI76367.1 hypothetical protein Vi05172_g13643 [Venturia inaequalis]